MRRKWIAMALAIGMLVANLPAINTFAEVLATDTVGTDTVGTDTVGTDTVGTDTVGTDTVGTGTVTTSTAGEENSNVSDFVFDKSTGTISSYKGTAKILTIPSEIDGVAVKRIKGTNQGMWEDSLCMFTSEQSRKNVEKIIIPSSVEVIEQFTFMGCINLKEIQLSEGLKKIGSYAFYACSFEKVDIPDSVIEIRKGAFSQIEELKEIKFPKGIKEINDEITYECRNLEKITIPKDATIIGAPFVNTVWAKSIMQNNNGFYIINNTLCGYSGTDEIVNIPDGVKTINREAFYDYTKIDILITQVPDGANQKERTVPIPKEATTTVPIDLEAIKNKVDPIVDPIDETKIYENSKIKEVVVPASVTLIKRQAFSNCTQLKSINIANPNVQIGEYCFRDNVTITIADKVLSQAQINNSKFDFDKSTGTITGYKGNETTLTIPSEIDGVKVQYIEASVELKAKGYGILGDNLTVEKVIIQAPIEVIKSGAFKNSINLYSIEFDGYTQSTEAGAYQGCSNLINVVNPTRELNKDKDAYINTAWQTKQDGPIISTTDGRGFWGPYPDEAAPKTGEKSNVLLEVIMTILSGAFVFKSYKKKKVQR